MTKWYDNLEDCDVCEGHGVIYGDDNLFKELCEECKGDGHK